MEYSEEECLQTEIKKLRKELKRMTEQFCIMNASLQGIVRNQNCIYFRMDPEGKDLERFR